MLNFKPWRKRGLHKTSYSYPTVTWLDCPLLGTLQLETGQITISDPFDSWAQPLKRRCPAGDYPLRVLTTETEYGSEPAGILLQLSDNPISKWEPAYGWYADNIPAGVGIDSASIQIGCAEHLAAAAKLDENEREHLSRKPHKIGPNIQYGRAEFNPKRSEFIVQILDDGGYPIWWGLDEQENPALLFVQLVSSDQTWEAWPTDAIRSVAPCPHDFMGMLNWVNAIDEEFSHGKMAQNIQQAVLARAGLNQAPQDIQLFWDHFAPWSAETLTEWLEREPSIRQKCGVCLPLQVSTTEIFVQLESGMVFYTEQPNNYWGCGRDIPTFFVSLTSVVYDLHKLNE